MLRAWLMPGQILPDKCLKSDEDLPWAIKVHERRRTVHFVPRWLQITISYACCCGVEKVSRHLLRSAQHLVGSAPAETWAGAGIGSNIQRCQPFGFGTENRVELILSGTSPWVILTAAESALLLLPDNQGACFLSDPLPSRKASVKAASLLAAWPVTVPGTALQGGLRSWVFPK